MKGTYFRKPHEFQLHVEGESWEQGETIEGTLTVRNHSSEPLPLSDVRILFAIGNLKKVKTRDDDAFEVVSEGTPGNGAGPVPAGGTSDPLPWKFELDSNFRISDTTGSLYFLYGTGTNPAELGQIQAPVTPVHLITDFASVFPNTFQFALRHHKAKKDCVETKFAPPSGKVFPSMEQAVVQTRFEGEDFLVDFVFTMKEIDATSPGTSLKKVKRTFERRFTPSEYRLFNGRLNKDFSEKAVGEVLDELRSKIFT